MFDIVEFESYIIFAYATPFTGTGFATILPLVSKYTNFWCATLSSSDSLDAAIANTAPPTLFPFGSLFLTIILVSGAFSTFSICSLSVNVFVNVNGEIVLYPIGVFDSVIVLEKDPVSGAVILNPTNNASDIKLDNLFRKVREIEKQNKEILQLLQELLRKPEA